MPLNKAAYNVIKYASIEKFEADDLGQSASNMSADEKKGFIDGYRQAMQNILDSFADEFPEEYEAYNDDNYSGPKEILQ